MAAISRLRTATESGALDLSGSVTIWHPPLGADLPVGPDNARIVHSFKPDVSFWEQAGFAVAQEDAPCDTAIVVLPRSKTLARDLIARAAASASGLIVVDGQKTDGVDSLFKDIRKLGVSPDTLTKAHGRLFWFAANAVDLAAWRASGPVQDAEGYWTQPGVFSEGQIDAGSRLLAVALPTKLGAKVADLGAGWGFLSRAILMRDGVSELHLVEAEARALDCARLNVTDDRAAFHWADATTWKAPEPLNTIVMNPPFHTGRAGDPGLGRDFIAAAARNLTPSGRLYMVANRHLPYETTLAERFRDVEELPGNSAFKLFVASRPKR